MTINYIFCPLCGGVKWITDKSGNLQNIKLDMFKCSGCKKFLYKNAIEPVEHPTLLNITKTNRYSIEAEIEQYHVSVYYYNNTTEFRDAKSWKIILILNQVISFNWYKSEELVAKIKKYILLS